VIRKIIGGKKEYISGIGMYEKMKGTENESASIPIASPPPHNPKYKVRTKMRKPKAILIDIVVKVTNSNPSVIW